LACWTNRQFLAEVADEQLQILNEGPANLDCLVLDDLRLESWCLDLDSIDTDWH